MSGKKKQIEDKCPYCGGRNGYVINVRISGYWRFNQLWNGENDSSDTDRIIYHKEPKTGVCWDCGKSVQFIKELKNEKRL